MLIPSGPNTIYSGDSLDQGFNFGNSESEDGVGVLPKIWLKIKLIFKYHKQEIFQTLYGNIYIHTTYH